MTFATYPTTTGRVYWNPAYPSFRQDPISGSVVYETMANWRYSSKTANYRAVLRNKGIAMNPLKVGTRSTVLDFHKAQIDFCLLSGTVVCTDQGDVRAGNPFRTRGQIAHIDPENFPDYQNLLAAALSEANSGEVDLLTSLMEAHESVDLVISAYKALKNPLAKFANLRRAWDRFTWPFMTKELRALRKRDASAFLTSYTEHIRKRRNRAKRNADRDMYVDGLIADATKLVAQLELTWRYGVMPNVYLLEDATNLAKKALTPSFLTVVRKVSNEELDDEKTLELNNIVEGTGGIWRPCGTYRRSGSNFIKVTVTSRFKFASSLDRLIAKEFDFNVIKTAHELLPLSFVGDWFAQIGEWIGSFFTPRGLVERKVCVSWRVNYRDTESYYQVNSSYPFGGANLHKVRVYPVTFNHERNFFQRKVVTGELAELRWNVQLNWKRAADAAALFRVMFL